MADLTAPLSGLQIIKLPDYNEVEYVVKANEAAIFNGALVDIDTTAGTVVHADDAAGRIFAGVAVGNNLADGVTAGNKVRVARGCIVFGLSVDTGTLAAADLGRPMYVGDDDQEIGDYSNVEYQRFVGYVRPNPAGDAWGVHIPAEFKQDKEGLVQFIQTTAVTGASQDITITGAGEIVAVQACIEEGYALTGAYVLSAKPHATAGHVEISVFKEDGTSGVGEASTVAANIRIVAWGFKHAVLA